MKTRILFFFLLFSSFASAQAPAWDWAHGAGGSGGHHNGSSICADASGNSYVTGYFQTPYIVFGNDTLFGSTNYHDNLFLVKYDNNGNLLWARSAGGQNNCQGNSVCVDANGNCYVTGNFHGSGTIVFGNDTLHGSGIDCFFIAKYDTNGNIVWARNSQGYSTTVGTGIGADAAGNAYVTGTFSDGDPAFGNDTLHNNSFIFEDVFLVKYDAAGNVVWAKSGGGSSSDYSTGLSVAANGNCSISGYSQSASMTFGSVTAASTASGYDIFVLRYDNAGNAIWLRRDGGVGSTYKPGIATDASGNCYITGYFNGTTAVFGTTTLANSGFNDIFVVKYTNAGNFAWAKRAGGPDADDGIAISAEANGNFYITGFYKATITFGTFNFTTFTSAGSTDIFVAKYDSAGSVVWAKNVSYGNNPDEGDGISNSHGNVYVTGHFFSTSLGFGNTTVMNADNSEPSNVFVAKLDSSITSGMADLALQNQISIYPNPSAGTFTIENSDLLHGFEQIEIYNTLGEQVYASANIRSSSVSIDLSAQAAGIYFVQLKTAAGMVSKKIMVLN